VKVALSGQGGDELFGGYPSFADVFRLRRMCVWLAWAPVPLRRALARVAFAAKPFSVRAKAVDMLASDGSVRSLYLHRRRTLANSQMAALGLGAPPPGLTADYLPAEDPAPVDLDKLTTREGVSLLETRYYLGNMLLRDGDADSMAHSLEVRVPFLDTRVLDLMLSLPEAVRFPEGAPPKALLRSGFAEVLRPAILRPGKRGFALPIRRWMRGVLRDLCEDGIRQLKTSALLDPRGVESVWRAFQREPESPAWTRAWSLCVLGDYLRRNCQ
jgi:asparagine synthase (glutamine-hydrolysing)